MRVLMTGGGTSGHVNPALAIANTIKEHEPDSVIAFVGTPEGIENKLVKKAGYKIYHVDVQGLKRSHSLKNLKTIRLALTSPVKAKKIIKKFEPDVVIGTGGYVCWPLMEAAAELKIPSAIHESNRLAGKAVRMIARKATRIYINFPETAKDLTEYSDKIMRVGNPLLSRGNNISKKEAREKLGIPEDCKYILSFGGSMGAQRVNEAMLGLMKDYVSVNENVYQYHATGAIEHQVFENAFNEAELYRYKNISYTEYIYDMPLREAACDLMITRAGAMTISECAEMKKCVIFIPSPNVAENHQYLNAKALVDKGAAELIEEKDLTGDLLEARVRELLEDDGKRKTMEENIAQFAVHDADEVIYNDIVGLIKNK